MSNKLRDKIVEVLEYPTCDLCGKDDAIVKIHLPSGKGPIIFCERCLCGLVEQGLEKKQNAL